MTVQELIDRLSTMPRDVDVDVYCSDLERSGDSIAYNWREITDVELIKCEHDDYVLMELNTYSAE